MAGVGGTRFAGGPVLHVAAPGVPPWRGNHRTARDIEIGLGEIERLPDPQYGVAGSLMQILRSPEASTGNLGSAWTAVEMSPKRSVLPDMSEAILIAEPRGVDFPPAAAED